MANKYGLHDEVLRATAARLQSWLKPKGLFHCQFHAFEPGLLSAPALEARFDDVTAFLKGYSGSSRAQVVDAFTAGGWELLSCEEASADVHRFFEGWQQRIERLYPQLFAAHPDAFAWDSMRTWQEGFKRGALQSLTLYRATFRAP